MEGEGEVRYDRKWPAQTASAVRVRSGSPPPERGNPGRPGRRPRQVLQNWATAHRHLRRRRDTFAAGTAAARVAVAPALRGMWQDEISSAAGERHRAAAAAAVGISGSSAASA